MLRPNLEGEAYCRATTHTRNELMSRTFQYTPRRIVTTDDQQDVARNTQRRRPPDVLELNGCRMHRLWQTDSVPAALPIEHDVTAEGLPPATSHFSWDAFLHR